jgi:hypothetical protein
LAACSRPFLAATAAPNRARAVSSGPSAHSAGVCTELRISWVLCSRLIFGLIGKRPLGLPLWVAEGVGVAPPRHAPLPALAAVLPREKCRPFQRLQCRGDRIAGARAFG